MDEESIRRRMTMDPSDPGALDLSGVWSKADLELFGRIADKTRDIVRWIWLGIRTGLRPQEQCGLQWESISWSARTLLVQRAVVEASWAKGAIVGKLTNVPKTGFREITLSEDGLDVLRLQQDYVRGLLRAGTIPAAAARFVFPSRGANPFSNPATVADRMRAAFGGRKDRKNSALLPGLRRRSPYGLRHTHATDLIRNGWDSLDVAARLGTSVEMLLKHYVHFLPDV